MIVRGTYRVNPETGELEPAVAAPSPESEEGKRRDREAEELELRLTHPGNYL